MALGVEARFWIQAARFFQIPKLTKLGFNLLVDRTGRLLKKKDVSKKDIAVNSRVAGISLASTLMWGWGMRTRFC